MAASTIEGEVLLRYRAIRARVAGAAKIAVLTIGAEQTGVAAGEAADPAVLVLAIGSRKSAREHFRHTPPRPVELEDAISNVEDELARAKGLRADGATLYSSDATVRQIAALSYVDDAPTMVLRLDELERTFERLARVAMGRPAAQEALPTDPLFAATLLILREFLQHLQFSSITVMT